MAHLNMPLFSSDFVQSECFPTIRANKVLKITYRINSELTSKLAYLLQLYEDLRGHVPRESGLGTHPPSIMTPLIKPLQLLERSDDRKLISEIRSIAVKLQIGLRVSMANGTKWCGKGGIFPYLKLGGCFSCWTREMHRVVKGYSAQEYR